MQPSVLWLHSLRPRDSQNSSPGQRQKYYPGQFHHLRLQKNWKHLPKKSVSDPYLHVELLPGAVLWQGRMLVALMPATPAAMHWGNGDKSSNLRPEACAWVVKTSSLGLIGRVQCLPARRWGGVWAGFGRKVAAVLPETYKGGSWWHLKPSGRAGFFKQE